MSKNTVHVKPEDSQGRQSAWIRAVYWAAAHGSTAFGGVWGDLGMRLVLLSIPPGVSTLKVLLPPLLLGRRNSMTSLWLHPDIASVSSHPTSRNPGLCRSLPPPAVVGLQAELKPELSDSALGDLEKLYRMIRCRLRFTHLHKQADYMRGLRGLKLCSLP